jgi:hypothetical protein
MDFHEEPAGGGGLPTGYKRSLRAFKGKRDNQLPLAYKI